MAPGGARKCQVVLVSTSVCHQAAQLQTASLESWHSEEGTSQDLALGKPGSYMEGAIMGVLIFKNSKIQDVAWASADVRR